jgi:predicted dehydrogenase
LAQGDAVGVALIGCGNRGVNSHGKVAKNAPNLRLAAVCDVDEQRAAAASDLLGVPAETDHRRLLERDDIQGFIIATSAKWHVPVALDAVRAGKHVLVEKPLADSTESSGELVRAAEQAGVVGITGYQLRFSPFSQAFKREVERIDPLQALVTRQRGPFRQQFFFPDHFGGIMDHASHDIHFALWLMGGEPTGVYASVARGHILKDETIELANIVIEFEGGKRAASIVASMHGLQAPNVVQVIGARGSVTTLDRKSLKVVRHGGIAEPLPAQPKGLENETVETPGDTGDGPDLTGQLLAHFGDLIAGRETVQRGATLREGAHAVAVTQAAVEAAQTGRRVAIDLS